MNLTNTRLSIVIPFYNESKTLGILLQKIAKVQLPHAMKKEIIVVDDGSLDNQKVVLQKLLQQYNLKVITHEKNMGKGAAVKTGLLISTGELVVIQDADLEYDPDDYLKLIEPFTNADADVVYGSRFIGGNSHKVSYLSHELANKFLTAFSNLLSGLKLTDMETCYKMFKGELIRNLAKNLVSKRFGFEPEITAKLAKQKVTFVEVGISYNGRTKEEGKKIGFVDGLKAIIEILKFNLLP